MADSAKRTAIEAIKRGYQPVPLLDNERSPRVAGWQKMRWENTPEGLKEAKEKFKDWAEIGHGNVGVLLGEPSNGLVDVDLDHVTSVKLRDHFLPRTAMRSGRTSRPGTHYWYKVEPDTVPGTRVYKLTDNATVSVELRSTGGQTALPPSIHPSGDEYMWNGDEFGGKQGPEEVNGRLLQVQVAVLGLASALLEVWPGEGSRHSAYLALAGGLLRVGEGVHPYWERNAPQLIGALADVTHDEDGGASRVAEVMDSTLKRLRAGKPVQGFTTLGEIIGEEEVRHIRLLVGEVEAAAGVPDRSSGTLSVDRIAKAVEQREKERLQGIHKAEQAEAEAKSEADSGTDHEDASGGLRERDPLDERLGSWEAVDLDPYLSGQVQPIQPAVLERDDGNFLMYRGRVNMLYGPSESAKSWIAMKASLQLIERGERVLYLDFEDEPVNSLSRLKLMGASVDDLRNYFTYVLPEEPLAPMERSRWGEPLKSEAGQLNLELFEKLLERVDPTLIVADGISELYGLHGLDTNDTSHTATITRWMKTITRYGRSTVIAIDHAPKNPQRGTLPIGSQHKVSMVQGTLIQAYPVSQPRPGARGEVELIVIKDRPGNVRAIGENSGDKAQLVARVIIDSTEPGVTNINFLEPDNAPKPNSWEESSEEAKQRVEADLRHIEEAKQAERRHKEEQEILNLYDGEVGLEMSLAQIATLLYGSSYGESHRRQIRKVLDRLRLAGVISASGSTRDRVYTLDVHFD